MKKLERKIWEFDNIVDNIMANYIENLCINQMPFFLGSGAEGTSEYSNKDLINNSLDKIHEYIQLSSKIIQNVNQHGKIESFQYQELNLDKSLPLLIPMFNCLSKMNLVTSFNDIIRCKLNLQPRVSEKYKDMYNRPHIDEPSYDQDQILTMIYYVNPSDGDTFFFNESRFLKPEDMKKLTIAKRIAPKKGKIVAFRSDIVHSGTHPIESDFRLAINYNVRVSEMNPAVK